jgi:hypothetical protein
MMRWIEHLLGALVVGILGVIIWEQFSGVSISQKVMVIFSEFNVGPGLAIAILAIVAFAIWAKSSSG